MHFDAVRCEKSVEITRRYINYIIFEIDTFPTQTILKDLDSCPLRIVFHSVDRF